MKIQMYKGDTIQVGISLTNNGEPFIPTTEKIVFSVGKNIGGNPIFSVESSDGIAYITHEMTKSMSPGNYKYDVRVYTENKSLVATPCYGDFELLGVVNNGI